MARIAGIDLPKDKRVEIGLTYIYGIGRTSANKILAEAGINPDTRVKDLTEEDEAKLREIIGHSYTVEGDLRRDVAMDIKRLTEIGCYRGMRRVITDLPPGAICAPTAVSTCPPLPEICRGPTLSEAHWPVRSTWSAALMEVMPRLAAKTDRSLV